MVQSGNEASFQKLDHTSDVIPPPAPIGLKPSTACRRQLTYLSINDITS